MSRTTSWPCQQAATGLAAAPAVTVAGIQDLQQALLSGHEPLGLRSSQNWIGGSDWHPLDAEFVPPPAEHVPALMADLADYMNSAIHGPLVQAALVHAQFETIHPFSDGNGRVGRALIHTILARRDAVRAAVLPVSLVLLTRSETYVQGLTAYRYDGPGDALQAQDGVNQWLDVFLDAVEVAVLQAQHFVDELTALREEWDQRLVAARQERGVRERPRADSTVARLLELPPGGTARHCANRSAPSRDQPPRGSQGRGRTGDAGILVRKQVEQNTTAYLARDVFDLLTVTERRLGSCW